MGLVEKSYSVLIVSAAENFNNSLTELMTAARFEPVRKAASVNAAQRLMAERGFDIVIVNSPLADDPGIRFAIDTSDLKGTVVLLIVRSEQHSDIYDRVRDHGVFTLSKPLARNTAQTAFYWMASARERLRKLEKKTGSIEEKMEEIRLVNRAKWLLISEQKMDEPAAHRYIEKQAMNRCATRREIAEGIINTYS